MDEVTYESVKLEKEYESAIMVILECLRMNKIPRNAGIFAMTQIIMDQLLQADGERGCRTYIKSLTESLDRSIEDGLL